MWTHTTVDNMEFLCPIKKLTCTPSASEVTAFNQSELYFKAGDNLDFFPFFLEPGTHKFVPGDGSKDSEPSCDWNVNGKQIHWPLTGIDCTLGLDNVKKAGVGTLFNAITSLAHNPKWNKIDILQCALKVLGGKGGLEGGACDRVIPGTCKSPTNHKFGGFYSTSPQNRADRVIAPVVTVDPRCKQYGYRRRMLELSSPVEVAQQYDSCSNVEYDMFLVIEGAHFAGLATPVATNSSVSYCPPIVLHSKSESEEGSTMEKLMVVVAPIEVESVDEESKLHLGSRPLANILEAFDSVSVGLKGQTTYDPITNNCVAMLRNMADPLDIEIDDRLIQFVSKRLLQESADHMFEMIKDSPTLTMLYEGSSRFLKGINKEDVLAKMIKLYI
jgi:hypothetical protein